MRSRVVNMKCERMRASIVGSRLWHTYRCDGRFGRPSFEFRIRIPKAVVRIGTVTVLCDQRCFEIQQLGRVGKGRKLSVSAARGHGSCSRQQRDAARTCDSESD